MKKWTFLGTGLVTLSSYTSPLWAQIPPVGPPGGVVPPVPPAAAAAPGNLWSFLCPTAEQKEECKRKFCNSKIGQLMNQGMKPVSILSGGILQCCPESPTAKEVEELKKKGGPEGAAAAIQLEEAEAKARRAAIRYLGTVDCEYFPEAEAELVKSLLTDRNECVRMEAAMALGRGCCCTELTIRALTIVLSTRPRPLPPAVANPLREKSDRVKAAASASLAHCLGCYEQITVPAKEELKQKETGVPAVPAGEKTARLDSDVVQAGGQQKAPSRRPSPEQIAEARLILSEYNQQAGIVLPPARQATSIIDLVRGVAQIPEPVPTATAEPAPAVPVAAEPAPRAVKQPVAPAPVAQAPTAKPAAMAPGLVPVPMYPNQPQSRGNSPVQQSMYVPAVTPTVTPATVALPVEVKPTFLVANQIPTQSSATPQELVNILHGSAYPEQREWAAQRLSQVDPRYVPQMVIILIQHAREDTAPIVRAACIRTLGQFGHVSGVTQTIEGLKTDRDPRVRMAAEQTLVQMKKS